MLYLEYTAARKTTQIIFEGGNLDGNTLPKDSCVILPDMV